ncbi:MAG: lipocalin-like domain-containing protein [Vicinamibacteria bacterium]
MRASVLAIVISVAALGCSPPDEPIAAADSSGLEGAWRVVWAEDRLENGEVASYPWGRHPVGLVLIDSGHISIQIVSRDRPAWPPPESSPDEMKEALEKQLGSYIAYFGSYTVDEAEGSLSIEVQGGWRPSYAGTKQKRYYELAGDRLTIGPAPRVVEGRQTVRRVLMERIR